MEVYIIDTNIKFRVIKTFWFYNKIQGKQNELILTERHIKYLKKKCLNNNPIYFNSIKIITTSLMQ